MRHILGLICDLIALILVESSAKGLAVIKHVKALKFKVVWDAIQKQNVPETLNHAIFEFISSFHVKW